MKVSSFAVARPMYWDRNQQSIISQYLNNSLAPASLTVRATVTVPATKLLFIDSAFVEMIRAGVAAVAGDVLIKIAPTTATTDYITSSQYDIIQAHAYDNVINGRTYVSLNGSLLLSASSVIDLITQDTSTGGLFAFHGAWHGVYFDK